MGGIGKTVEVYCAEGEHTWSYVRTGPRLPVACPEHRDAHNKRRQREYKKRLGLGESKPRVTYTPEERNQARLDYIFGITFMPAQFDMSGIPEMAENECSHGSVATDKNITCNCWGKKA